jgi:hypothetical protein
VAEQTPDLDAAQLWQEVNDLLHEGPVNRPLWDAARIATPITVTDEAVVVGLDPKDMRHASYLRTDINRSRLRAIIHARTGRNLELKVIEGTDLEALRRVEERENASVHQSRARVNQVRSFTGTGGVWQEAATKMAGVISASSRRSFATTRARLLAKLFPVVWEAEQKAAAEEKETADNRERQLNRLLDRVANHTELPATVVALEYLRYSAGRKQS